MKKLEGIEASRGIAALLVVLMHTTSLFSSSKYFGHAVMGGLWTFGHAGVDFFFVLSGFIIYYVHAGDIEHASRLPSYWRKRLIRIYPTYWVVLAGYGVLLYLSPSKDLYEQSLTTIVANIFLIPQNHTPILGVAWSLSHEILFYAIFSTLFFCRTAGRLIFGFWFIAILTNLIFPFSGNSVAARFVFNQFNLEFFFGLLVAYIHLKQRRYAQSSLLWLGLTIFFSTGLYESLVLGKLTNHPLLHLGYATASSMIICGLAKLEQEGRLHTPRLLALLGQSSYSIYLVHVVVVMLFQQVYLRYLMHMNPPEIFVFVLCVLSAVIGGILVSLTIELPLLRFLRRQTKTA